MMKSKRIFMRIIVLCMALLLVFLTGCTQANTGANAPVNDAENSNQTSSDTITTGYDFIFVCPVIQNEYWQDCINGIERADTELGTKTTVTGSETIDNFAEEMVAHFKEALDAHPDGILTYAGIAALTPYIERAAKEGIPVVTVDADSSTDKRVAFVGTNLYNLGRNAGETMLSHVGKHAKVGYICTDFTANNEKEVFDAFCEVARENGIEVVAQKEGGNSKAVAAKAAQEMLAAHPEITGIFCTGGENVTGAGQYIQTKGLNTKLIGMEDTQENLELLRAGAIDALFVQSPDEMGYIGVYVLKEYLDKGSLPSTFYGTESTLVTRENIDTYQMGEFSPNLTLKDVTVGYYTDDAAFQSGDANSHKSGYGYEYLQTIASLTGWRYQYVYGSKEELLVKLAAGEIDLMAGIEKSEDKKGAFLLSTSDMGLPDPKRYFGVSASRRDLYEELEGAMRKLQTENPTYTANLYTQYYEIKSISYALTTSERAYLRSLGTLRFGYLRNNLPLCDETADGEPSGLAKDLIEQIAQYTGVEVVPVAFDTGSELETALSTDEIDIAFPVYSDLWLSEEKHFKQTKSFVSDRAMIVYTGSYSDELFNKIAVSQSNVVGADYMTVNYPDAELVYYNTKKEVFDAVKKGEANCTIGCSGVLQYFLAGHSEYADLHIAYLDKSVELSMSVPEEKSYLISILDKTISNMGAAKINSALLAASGVEQEKTFAEIVRQNSLIFVMILVVFLAVLALAFILFTRQSRKHRRQQEETNEQLAQALKAAEEASEAKTTFLSSMSHDIRTPLNAILGMTTLALEDPNIAVTYPDYLGKIEISGKHLLTLINDVLDIAKIESGKLSLNPGSFSLKNSMRTLDEVIKSAAREKQIDFSMDYEDLEQDHVLVDKVRMEQVFLNLLSNAIKYTPDGGTVSASLTSALDPKTKRVQVLFIVKDNGVGMSEEFMKTMYDSFSRVEDSRTSKIQGTGLGLAIVKQVVDMMNGTIVCESKEGIGTKFTVQFDLDPADLPEAEEETQTDVVSFEGLHALVAEDNELNWVIAEKFLGHCGITCERAVDGVDCIEKMEASEPGTYDFILMDVQMPNMNGKDATRQIRKSEREDIRQIPVIAATADAFAEDVADCLEAGMDGHVSKPIEMDKMQQEMQRVFAKKGVSAKKAAAAEDEKETEPAESTSAKTETNKDESHAATEEFDNWFAYEDLLALLGNEEDALLLINSFLTEHGEDLGKLTVHIEAKEYYEARQILHTLVGVTGGLYMKKLCKASKRLGADLRAEREDSFGYFTVVWNETITVVQATHQTLEETTN